MAANVNLGFIGHVELGGTLSLFLQCLDDGTPTAPDGAPLYTIYLPDGTVGTTGSLGVADHDSKVGLRRGTVSILEADDFEAGQLCSGLFSYAIDEVAKTCQFTFRVQ